MGWTRRSVAFSVLLAMEAQQREIAKRVIALRDARGLTNESLAREAGVATKTVSRLVNAKHDARGDTLRKVAKALGVTEFELRGSPPTPLGLDAGAHGDHDDHVRALLEQQNANLAQQTEILEELQEQVTQLGSAQQDLYQRMDALAASMATLAEELGAARREQQEPRRAA